MSREVKRVPLDFDLAIGTCWTGYINPRPDANDCRECGGDGASAFYRHLSARWNGRAPFDPAETGSRPFEPTDSVIRDFAARNIATAGRSPYPGKNDVARLQVESERLAALFNSRWCHHPSRDDVDALVADKRLPVGRADGWAVQLSPRQVGERSIRDPFFLDGGAQHCVLRAACRRVGMAPNCAACDGNGYTWASPEAKAYHRIPGVEDYSYWSNTDRPDELTDDDWAARESDWDKALGPTTRPAGRCVTFQMASTVLAIPPSRDEIDQMVEKVEAAGIPGRIFGFEAKHGGAVC